MFRQLRLQAYLSDKDVAYSAHYRGQIQPPAPNRLRYAAFLALLALFLY